MMILIVAALVIGGIFLFRRFSAPVAAGPSAPLDVLRQRYARGEISREQFEEMKENLQR